MTARARSLGLGLLVVLTACSSGGGDATATRTPSSPPPTLAAEHPRDGELRLNHIQALATHNSYHPGARATPLPASHAAFEDLLGYRHPTLAEQLDLGVRGFAFDVWADPEGGRYVHRPLLEGTGADVVAPESEWAEPGLKVQHIAQIDPRSTCILFTDCLAQLDDWSDDHPGHLPIMVVVEIKDVDFLGTVAGPPLEPWQAADYDALDAEIRAVIPARKLLTPDDVQGDAPTLEEAVRTRGWPTLQETRGRFFFVSCNCLVNDRHRIDYVGPTAA